MKILVDGNLKKVKIFRCNTCGCVFEADNSEYKYSRAQYNQSYYECKCPCCGKTGYGDGE